MAVAQRRPTAVIHHSDQGCQYTLRGQPVSLPPLVEPPEGGGLAEEAQEREGQPAGGGGRA